MLDGEWEPSLIASIRNLINEGDESTLFVDIGANIGLTSVPMCNDVTKLIAIEPNPVSALILQANLMLSSRSNNYSIVEKSHLRQCRHADPCNSRGKSRGCVY